MEKKTKKKTEKRVFKVLTYITEFEVYEISKEGAFRRYTDADGEVVKFNDRKSCERYCEKRGLCYIEIKYTFYR